MTPGTASIVDTPSAKAISESLTKSPGHKLAAAEPTFTKFDLDEDGAPLFQRQSQDVNAKGYKSLSICSRVDLRVPPWQHAVLSAQAPAPFEGAPVGQAPPSRGRRGQQSCFPINASTRSWSLHDQPLRERADARAAQSYSEVPVTRGFTRKCAGAGELSPNPSKGRVRRVLASAVSSGDMQQ